MPRVTQASHKPNPVQQEVAEIASMPQVHAAFNWLRANEQRFREQQLEMVRIPAPSFHEGARAEWLRNRFSALGLEEVQIDEIGNVIGIRRGANADDLLIAITAHIDTVFPPETKIQAREEGGKLYGPGITDNATGVTALLAIAGALKDSDIANGAGIVFIGNVGEEGEGDLRGMRHLFTKSPLKDQVGSTVVIDGSGVDTYVTQALGSRRFEVVVRGPGGHSWADFGTPNPIYILSRAVARIGELPVPAEPKTSLSFGTIEGGTSVNSIPESASARIDIRSASAAEIDRLERGLREVMAEVIEQQKTASGKNAKITYEINAIGSRPAGEIKPGARIVQVVRAVDAHLRLESRPRRASTDANIPISMGREAISIGGGGSGGGAHTLHEWYDPAGRDLGLKRILLVLLTLTGVNE